MHLYKRIYESTNKKLTKKEWLENEDACRSTSQGQNVRDNVKGIVTSNACVQYESPMSSCLKGTTKIKVHVHTDTNADARAMTLAPQTYMYLPGSLKMNMKFKQVFVVSNLESKCYIHGTYDQISNVMKIYNIVQGFERGIEFYEYICTCSVDERPTSCASHQYSHQNQCQNW